MISDRKGQKHEKVNPQPSSFIPHPCLSPQPSAFSPHPSLYFRQYPPAGEEIKAYAAEATQILKRIDVYQKVVADLAEEVRQDCLIPAEQLAKVSDANRTIDDLQARLGRIAAAIGNTEFSDDNTLTNTLAANTAAGTSYPYSTEVSLALAGLTALTGLWGTRPGRQGSVISNQWGGG